MYIFDDETKDRIIEKLELGEFEVNISNQKLTCGKITFSLLIHQVGDRSYVHHTIIPPAIFYKHAEIIMNKSQGNMIQEDLNTSIINAYNRGVMEQNKIRQYRLRDIV